ncbi:MAG: TraB/GumN family protein [Nitrospiraceae bacterium]|nr:TraB/GumN family protein [Nitrospiraceae bacterium]
MHRRRDDGANLPPCRHRTVFAAVGSLHMIGPQSVLTPLEKMGYKIERGVFDIL